MTVKKYLAFLVVITGLLIGRMAFAQTNAVLFKLDDETKNILRDATTDSWFKKEAFTSALLGGLTAVVAAWFAYRWEIRKEKRADEEFNLRVLDAIQTELKTLLEIYDADVSKKLKDLKEGEVFPHWSHFSQNHFIIYETNASHIGKIDPELAKQLIKVHEFLKVLVESFGINSRYVMESDQIAWGLRQRPTDQQLSEKQQNIHALMVAQGQEMKRLDNRVRVEADLFFRRFDELKQQRSLK